MARKRSASLTDGEARLMTVLWQRASRKGYIEHRKSGRAFVYRPVVDQQQARRRALKHLVTRLFNGSPSLLVLNVLEHERIAPDELKRLKQLLDRTS